MGIINFLTKRILLLLLISASFASCFYSSKTTTKLFEEAKGKKFDMVIVPGVPFEDGKWSRIMKGRIYWAKYLYDQGIAKNIMFSGSSVYTPYYEGKIMALYAVAIGIPQEHVYSETNAEHSTENIYYSYRKSKKMGFKTLALASDPFQTRTLRNFTLTKVSPDIAMIPFIIDTMKVLEPKMIDPNINYAEAFNKNFISIKKREGFFKRLRGTMGLNIKTDDELTINK